MRFKNLLFVLALPLLMSNYYDNVTIEIEYHAFT